MSYTITEYTLKTVTEQPTAFLGYVMDAWRKAGATNDHKKRAYVTVGKYGAFGAVGAGELEEDTSVLLVVAGINVTPTEAFKQADEELALDYAKRGKNMVHRSYAEKIGLDIEAISGG